MPDKADTAQHEPQWTDVKVGLGDEWDFDKGPLVGNYTGSTAMTLKGNDGKEREQAAHLFSLQDEPDRQVFVWGSYQIDQALASEDIELGSLVRITFLGVRQFTADDGPRQVKQYRVQVAR